ncbi:MAG: diguanylate cyclase [Vicinamibacteria bacterium]
MRLHFFPALLWASALTCLTPPAALQAEETCGGAPFVNVIRPRAMEDSANATVGPQIFGVAAHPRGFMLMANNNGVLTYDGVGWRLLGIGRSSVALSVAVGPDGRMFAGGSRTFGEVVEDPTGELLYRPLESRLAPADRAFSDVWQTLVSSKGITYFRSLERLMVVNSQEVRAFSPSGRFVAAGLVNDVLYALDSSVGLVAFGPSGPTAVPGGEIFRGARVTVITAGPDLKVLIGTQDQGLFQMDVERGQVDRLGAALPSLTSSEILSVRTLADREVAVGTLHGGLFVLGGDGSLRLHLDRDSGLPDNAVLSLEAANGSLWAGTSGGVAQILIPSSVENFGPREGLPGLVESIVQHEGMIYAATSQGVFRLTCHGQAFEPVPSLRKQSFSLLSAQTLLAATADGIYEIKGKDVRLVRAGLARALSKSKDAGIVWAATQSGAVGLEWNGSGWGNALPVMMDAPARTNPASTTTTPTTLTDVEATSIGEDRDVRLWIGLVTGEVVSGLPIRRNPGIQLTAPKIFDEADGLSGFAEVVSLRDGLQIGTSKAVLRPTLGRLVPDPFITQALGTGQGAFRIADSRNGGYWIASSKRPLHLIKEGNGLTVQNTALLRVPAGSRILDFLEVSATEVWIGTDDGAFRYNPSLDALDARMIAASVRRGRSNQTDVFSGGSSPSIDMPLPYLAPVRFEVASSSLDDPSRNRFRVRLDGQDADWSPWSAETRKDYTNLGPGSYRFRVETRDVYGRVGKEGAVSFVVLAPWYRKPWAMILGVFLLGALFYAALTLRTRSLQRRQRELEEIVELKTRQLREASFTDPLTGLRNRRYFAEVIDGEVSLACRPGSAALHMFLVDLDHFKQVNDVYGHGAGDEILKQVASRLKIAMRTSDIIFRWGGEEFLIVARGAPDLPRNEIANRIVRMLGKEPYALQSGMSITKTCSVGFSTFPFYGKDPTAVPLDAVIELADLSLYRAKQTGRNRAVGVSPQTGAPVLGEVWKDKVLENLEKAAVSIEVLEGPPQNP